MTEEPGRLDISDEMIAERRGGTGKMPEDMPTWMSKTIVGIDRFSKLIGNIVCWITIPLILGMVYEVFARKLFLAPTILLNLSIPTIVFDIHKGMSFGIFLDPPLLSAIISSEISNLVGFFAICSS